MTPAAAVTPNWSVDVGGFEWDPVPREIRQLVMAGPDQALYVSDPASTSRISVLALGLNASVRDHVLAIAGATPQPVFRAGNASGAILAMESSTDPGATVRLDSRGRVLWRLDRAIGSAQLLANGDALVIKQDILARLAAADGRVVWARNLLEVGGSPDAGRYAMGEVAGDTVPLSARYQVGLRSVLMNLAIDGASGEIRWAAEVRSELPTVSTRCAPMNWDTDRVDVRIESDDSRGELVVERRTADGTLLASARHPASSADPEACAALVVGSTLYLALYDVLAPPQLWAFDADGSLRWKRDISSARGVRMLAADTQDLVFAQADFASGRHIVSRVRAVDGAQLWRFDVPAQMLEMQGQADRFTIAWRSPAGGPARLAQHSLSTGELMAESQADLHSVRERAVAAVGWNGQACTAEAQIEAPESINLVCRDAQSGVPLWTTHLPAVDGGERIHTLRLELWGDAGLMLRASTSAVLRQGSWSRDRLYALDAATGLLRWQSAHAGLLAWSAGIDGAVYVQDRDCALPPLCTGGEYRLRKLAASDGAVIWTREGGPTPLAANTSVLIGWRQDSVSRGFDAIDTANGDLRWEHPVANGSLFPVAALITRAGAIYAKYELGGGGSRSVVLRRLDDLTGNSLHAVTPRVPQSFVGSFLMQEAEDGDLLTSATRSGGGGWLQRTAVVDGAPRWDAYPAGTDLDLRRVRFLPGRPDARWATQIRTAQSLERSALSAMDPNSGVLAGEHLYAVASKSDGTPFGSVTLLGAAMDGRVFALDESRVHERLHATRLQGWPAPGVVTGDVQLELLDADAGTSLGPSTRIRLRVRNEGAAPLSGAWLRAWAADSTLWFRLVDCTPTTTCVTETRDAVELAMPAQSTVDLVVAVYGPGWAAARPTGVDRALFRVDPPFDYGDLDLGNNLGAVLVQLGGMGSGFE